MKCYICDDHYTSRSSVTTISFASDSVFLHPSWVVVFHCEDKAVWIHYEHHQCFLITKWCECSTTFNHSKKVSLIRSLLRGAVVHPSTNSIVSKTSALLFFLCCCCLKPARSHIYIFSSSWKSRYLWIQSVTVTLSDIFFLLILLFCEKLFF